MMKTRGQRHLNRPWLITRSGLQQYVHACENAIERGLEHVAQHRSQSGARPKFNIWGAELPAMWQANETTFIVPISGAIIKGADYLDMLFGATSHENISEDLDSAVAGGAETIILDINSPGGTVTGTEEIATKIDGLRDQGINIGAYTETMAASAAVWIGTVADIIGVTPSSEYGSIGVLYEHISYEAMLEQAGINVSLITSGEHKAAGHPAKDLTEAQAALFQQEVDDLARGFQEHVNAYRPEVKIEDMQGQVFTGRQAVAKGFADALVGNLGEFIGLLA